MDKYLESIKDIVLKNFKDSNVKIIFFGSRAVNKKVTRASDVDIGIEGEFKEIDFINLKEELEESPIPYEVDLINLNFADEKFKEEIFKKGIFWKN